MSSNAARADVLARALRAGLAGELDVVAGLVTDDVHAWTPAFATATRDELLAAIDRREDAFSDHTLDVSPLDAGGDFACAEWTVAMTHAGDLQIGPTTIAPTGTRVVVHGITVAEFAGDRICSLRQYWDELAMLAQLGLLPA